MTKIVADRFALKWMFLSLAVAVGFTGCRPPDRTRASARPSAAEAKSYEVGNVAAPNLFTPAEQVSLEALRGKVVLVDFWATWCPPCRSELPMLNKLYSEYSGRGLEIIGMTVDQGDPKAIAHKVAQLGLRYPAVLAGPEVQQTFGGIRVVPTKFLLDKEGKVRKFYQGVVSEKDLRDDIESLLAL